MLSTEQMNYYRQIIRRPVVTEKSMRMSDQHHVYTFEVAPEANKVEIRRAIEGMFDVTVTKVNTMRVVGKKRQRSFRHGAGRTAERKKAIVFLAPGDTIDVVEMGG